MAGTIKNIAPHVHTLIIGSQAYITCVRLTSAILNIFLGNACIVGIWYILRKIDIYQVFKAIMCFAIYINLTILFPNCVKQYKF